MMLFIALKSTNIVSPSHRGALRNARYLEPVAGLNIHFAYGAGKGTGIAPAWIARTQSTAQRAAA